MICTLTIKCYRKCQEYFKPLTVYVGMTKINFLFTNLAVPELPIIHLESRFWPGGEWKLNFNYLVIRSVFGLHLLLMEISGSLVANCLIVLTSYTCL